VLLSVDGTNFIKNSRLQRIFRGLRGQWGQSLYALGGFEQRNAGKV
jgi:hypothetical protein